MGHWSRSRFYRVVVVVVEVAMHMRRAKKKKKKDGSASQPITNKLTQPKSNVAFLLNTLVEGVPHHTYSQIHISILWLSLVTVHHRPRESRELPSLDTACCNQHSQF